MKYEINFLLDKYGGKYRDECFEDENDYIHAIIYRDYKDVLTFAKMNQLDMMLMMVENLNFYECSLGFLRSLLKND